ncbi:uncharacterized protein [Branchiostoma lanceolatum]|uniref:uncharacterized protein n=1 Tax=Branchiostoma lanceolatum TaxID=7740 RepID=UPI00345169C3
MALTMKAALEMNADACVVVSGLTGGVNSRALREHFLTEDSDFGIKKLVTFPKLGTALVEFLTPKGAADVLATETELQVRRLRSVLPKDEDVTTLPRERSAVNVHVLFDLYTFLLSLPRPRDHIEHGLQSGASRVPEGIDDVGDLNMDADACVVVSGFPGDVDNIMFHIGIRRAKCIRQAVVFPATGTALMEFFTPGWAANVLADQNRLFEKTGLRAMDLAHLFSPNEDATTSETQLSRLEQQLESAKKDLRNKEQQLQGVMTENEHLKTVQMSLKKQLTGEKQANRCALELCQRLEQDNVHLKNQAEADKRVNARLREQNSSFNISSYDMSRDRRGTAVIINNMHFEDMADRDGAERDTDRLREVFESLGFTVVTFHDLDHSKMVSAMKDQGKADHSNSDCFVCCIMSHGTMGKVYSSDDVGIDICELMKPVNAKKCPSLKGKPKLFFIQACQGEKSQGREGLDGEHDAKPVPFICHEADFFLGLATVPGYVARRDRDGAPYVHHLAKMLADFGPTHDLSAIMAMVCDKMNDINDDKFGWISSNHSTLRKKVVFNTNGLPDSVYSRALRWCFQFNYAIRRLVTLPKLGTALIEFLTPEDAADVLAKETELQVRTLRSLLPKDEDMTTLPRETCARNMLSDLWTFFKSLPRPRDDVEHGLESGAANLLAHQNRLFEKTRLRAMNLAHLFPPNEEATTSEGQLLQLKQHLESAEQNLRSKEQQLQGVVTENEDLKTVQMRLKKELTREKQAKRCALELCQRLEAETLHLKNQADIDKRAIERLKNQAEADRRENARLKKRISASNGISSSYDLSRSPRGTAVIINNIHFEDMADRDGAEGDTDRLREVFESLGFTVVTFYDLDNNKMVATIKDQGKADQSNSDCFVCCIMSHGTMGKVYSSDDVGIDICELMKPVNAKKCPSLKGKPKLFFIQACQGDKRQGREGLDGEHDAKPVPFICHEADFFLGLATVPGYVARRDQDGAPYVHHLAKMLADFGPTHDLSTIMAMVCGKMNDINDDKFGWISSNHSTLRKKVVFNVK